jgi:hypothetical protein
MHATRSGSLPRDPPQSQRNVLLAGVQVPVLEELPATTGRGIENFIALISGSSNLFTSLGSTP